MRLAKRQFALAHLAVERDLDVDFIVRAIDARRIVDEVGVDAPAADREFDPAGLGDGKVRAFADDLAVDFVGADPERVVGRVADIALALGRGFDVGADAAEPDQVDRALEDEVDQRWTGRARVASVPSRARTSGD